MSNNRINIGILTYGEFINNIQTTVFTCIIERVHNWSDTYNKVHLSIHYYSNRQFRWVLLNDIKIFEVDEFYLQKATEFFKNYVDNLNDK